MKKEITTYLISAVLSMAVGYLAFFNYAYESCSSCILGAGFFGFVAIALVFLAVLEYQYRNKYTNDNHE